MATSPTNSTSRPQPHRNESRVSYRIFASDGSWSLVDKDSAPLEKFGRRFSARKVLRHATMPLPGRTTTERTVASSTFSKIDASPESAKNGISAWYRAMIYLSDISGLAAATRDSASVGPPLVFEAIGLAMPSLQVPPFTPDIEVRSKRRKGPFASGFKWKEMRAVLDTGCAAGNWVSLDTLQDLGYGKLLKATGIEKKGAVTANGFTLQACAAVNLTWRGVPGEGPEQIGNCSRNFKMRFQVLAISPAPFAILIGGHSIFKHQILPRPMFMAPRNVVVFSKETKVKTTVPSYTDRKAANEKKKKDLLKSKKAANPAVPETVPSDKSSDPVAVNKGKDPTAAISRTDTRLSITATLHDETVGRVHELIENEAGK